MNLRIIQRFRHTIVALEESSAEDASFFQVEICFTFGRIFVYKRKFFFTSEEMVDSLCCMFYSGKNILHH